MKTGCLRAGYGDIGLGVNLAQAVRRDSPAIESRYAGPRHRAHCRSRLLLGGAADPAELRAVLSCVATGERVSAIQNEIEGLTPERR
jgi:hypothetical protein